MINYSRILQTGIQSLLAVAGGWACGRWSILDPEPTVAYINTLVLKVCIPCLQVWLLAIKTDMREPGNWSAMFAFLFWSMSLQVLLAVMQLFRHDMVHLAKLGVDSLILTTNNTGILGPVVLQAALGHEYASLGMLATVVLYFQQLPSAQLMFQLHKQHQQQLQQEQQAAALPSGRSQQERRTQMQAQRRFQKQLGARLQQLQQHRNELEPGDDDMQEQQLLLGGPDRSIAAGERLGSPNSSTSSLSKLEVASQSSLFSVTSFSNWDLQNAHQAAVQSSCPSIAESPVGRIAPAGCHISRSRRASMDKARADSAAKRASTAEILSFEISEHHEEPGSPVMWGRHKQQQQPPGRKLPPAAPPYARRPGPRRNQTFTFGSTDSARPGNHSLHNPSQQKQHQISKAPLQQQQQPEQPQQQQQHRQQVLPAKPQPQQGLHHREQHHPQFQQRQEQHVVHIDDITAGSSSSAVRKSSRDKDSDAGSPRSIAEAAPAQKHSSNASYVASLLLKNPLVWSTGVSLLLSCIGSSVLLNPDSPLALHQLTFVEALLGWFANTTAPLTLFTTGLWMYSNSVKQQQEEEKEVLPKPADNAVPEHMPWVKLCLYLLARATVAPGFMVVVCWVMGFKGDLAHALVILSLLPVGQTAFVVCKEAEVGTHAVSVVMVASLLLMLPQLMVMLALLEWLGVFA